MSVDASGAGVSALLATLRRRWSVVAVLTAAGLGLGVAHTVLTTPRYEATATVYFSLQRGETVSELAQGSTYTLGLVQTYASVATMPVVLDPVIARLGLNTTSSALARDVTARAPLGTVTMEITADRSDPDEAADVANAVAQQLNTTATQLASGSGGSGAITITPTEPASTPSSPSSPRPTLDAAAGLAAGLLVGVLAALAGSLLSGRVGGREELARVTDVPMVGAVPRESRRRRGALPGTDHRLRAGDEAYRALRTNLEFLRVGSGADAALTGGPRSDAGGCQVVVVTSALPGEGKTTTAVSLAVAIAEAGQRVLLIDADLRGPSVAPVMGLEGSVGLSTVLAGRAGLADVVQVWGASGLQVLAAGEVPPNPSEMLSSTTMVRLLAAVRGDHDVVLLDTAPTLPVTDAALLGARTDGTLLVVDARRTGSRSVEEAITRLTTAGSPVLGVVLNRTSRARDDGYGRRRSRWSSPRVRAERDGAASPRPAGAPLPDREQRGPEREDHQPRGGSQRAPVLAGPSRPAAVGAQESRNGSRAAAGEAAASAEPRPGEAGISGRRPPR